jgi:DNA/RNA-binding domain of Phe-tRNA-synthetase-like protein
MKLTFRYDPLIFPRFPSLRAGVILAHGISNQPTPPPLLEAFLAEQRQALQRIGATPLSEIPSLAAWRAAFREFGVDPTKYRSAAESLLRRLTKKGDIPSINALVDLCNLVSIRYAMPVAAFEARAVQGSIRVHFSSGQESFLALGESAAEQPAVGEVIFSGANHAVVARRWCWRQSEDSAAQLNTQEAIICTEAHHANAKADVAAAIRDILDLMQSYTGGTTASGDLDPSRLEISQ